MKDIFNYRRKLSDNLLIIIKKNKIKLKYNTVCPCCGFIGLSDNPYDICILCNWENDGQDDPNADEIWGGPNHDYSLTQARNNFLKYFVMYTPDNNLTIGEDSKLEKQAKQKIIDSYEKMFNLSEVRLLKKEAFILNKYFKILYKEMNRKIVEYEKGFDK